MNTPNKLTLLRIILVVPFAIFLILGIVYGIDLYSSWSIGTTYFLVAGIIFALGMITDFVDGHLARKNNQITTFGKLFDPLADKFMTTTAFVLLTCAGIVPVWVTLIFILRDILVDGSRNLAAANNVKVAASIWGKAKTMLQSIGLVLIFAIYPVADLGVCKWYVAPTWELWLLNAPVIISALLSIISGFKYFMAIVPYIKTK